MQIQLNWLRRTTCHYAGLPIDQLSDEQLLIRRTKTRQMGGVVVMLMLLMVAMAFIMDVYFVAVTSSAMIPALDEYMKKSKAITLELQKRNLR